MTVWAGYSLSTWVCSPRSVAPQNKPNSNYLHIELKRTIVYAKKRIFACFFEIILMWIRIKTRNNGEKVLHFGTNVSFNKNNCCWHNWKNHLLQCNATIMVYIVVRYSQASTLEWVWIGEKSLGLETSINCSREHDQKLEFAYRLEHRMCIKKTLICIETDVYKDYKKCS